MAIETSNDSALSKSFDQVSQSAAENLFAGAYPCIQKDGSNVCGPENESKKEKGGNKQESSLEITPLAWASQPGQKEQPHRRQDDSVYKNPRQEQKVHGQKEQPHSRQDDSVYNSPRHEQMSHGQKEQPHKRQDDSVYKNPRQVDEVPSKAQDVSKPSRSDEDKHSRVRAKG